MSYLSNPGDNLTTQQQTILNTFTALATTPAGYSGAIGGRLMFGDGTGWRFNFATGLPNSPTDIMQLRDTGEIYGNFLPPQGYMTNGKIVTSVASPTNPTTWANGHYFGFSWLYNIV